MFDIVKVWRQEADGSELRFVRMFVTSRRYYGIKVSSLTHRKLVLPFP